MSSFGQQKAQVNQRLLVGEWTRTDAPCQIKITETLDNGKLELTYFNPKSMNTGKAYWTKIDAVLSVYVELQDGNYPGSYYKLNYNVERDMFVGNYFQAISETMLAVEFARTKQY